VARHAPGEAEIAELVVRRLPLRHRLPLVEARRTRRRLGEEPVEQSAHGDRRRGLGKEIGEVQDDEILPERGQLRLPTRIPGAATTS